MLYRNLYLQRSPALPLPSLHLNDVPPLPSKLPTSLPTSSYMHWRQAQNLTPLSLPQLLSHDTVQPRTQWLPRLINKHTSIIIKAYKRPIWSCVLLFGTDNDGVSDVTSANLCRRCGDTGEFCAEVALFLDDDDNAVSCGGR